MLHYHNYTEIISLPRPINAWSRVHAYGRACPRTTLQILFCAVLQLHDFMPAMMMLPISAFNSLSRYIALLNIQELCPPFSVPFVNQHPVACPELFVDGVSTEGTTQGDPMGMPMHALGILPLIHILDIGIQFIKFGMQMMLV